MNSSYNLHMKIALSRHITAYEMSALTAHDQVPHSVGCTHVQYIWYIVLNGGVYLYGTYMDVLTYIAQCSNISMYDTCSWQQFVPWLYTQMGPFTSCQVQFVCIQGEMIGFGIGSCLHCWQCNPRLEITTEWWFFVISFDKPTIFKNFFDYSEWPLMVLGPLYLQSISQRLRTSPRTRSKRYQKRTACPKLRLVTRPNSR